MLLKKVRLIITPALILLCIMVAGIFFLKTVIQRPAVQRYLIETVSKAFGYELQIDEVKINFWKGKMENLSEIKWCAQKICELIESGQGNERLGDVWRAANECIQHTVFKNVEAKPPVIEDES